MSFPQFGFCMFADGKRFTDEIHWKDFLTGVLRAGYSQAQFLLPDTPSEARFVNTLMHDQGLTQAHALCCTFGDVCPCKDPAKALDAWKKFFDLMAIFADGFKQSTLFSPSALRALGDPDHGLAGDTDVAMQTDFISKLDDLQRVRNIKGLKLIVEPLGPFETRGPNTIGETKKIIADARAATGIVPAGDTCHALLTERLLVADTMAFYANDIGEVFHISAKRRAYLADDPQLLQAIRQMRSNQALSKKIWTAEAFCDSTDKGFLGLLGIHSVAPCTALEMAFSCISAMKSAFTAA